METAVRESTRHNGARLLTGGERDGAVVSPAVISGVSPDAALSQDELFGPAVAVTSVSGIDEAVQLANSTNYGLGAGVFTGDVATRCASRARSTPATCTSTGPRCGGPTSCPTAGSRARASARRVRAPQSRR